jgi:hypothetical protein
VLRTPVDSASTSERGLMPKVMPTAVASGRRHRQTLSRAASETGLCA